MLEKWLAEYSSTSSSVQVPLRACAPRSAHSVGNSKVAAVTAKAAVESPSPIRPTSAPSIAPPFAVLTCVVSSSRRRLDSTAATAAAKSAAPMQRPAVT